MASQNINREVLIDTILTSTDYEDKQGFFFHTTVGGAIKYLPKLNGDSETITKTFEASDIYNNCVEARKIFKTDTAATGIYVGKGV